jgi:5-methylcytosine-specific restriction endonuclease McrA
MRAKKICSHVDAAGSCPNLQPCPIHPRKRWAGSARDHGLQTLTSGSRRQQRARYVIDRDDTVCHWCGRPGADEADHVVALAHGGADTVDNMAAIHGAKYGADSCHAQKTRLEAQGIASPPLRLAVVTGDLA